MKGNFPTFREWLCKGGGGFEGGEDGIRACTIPMSHVIELVDEYLEFRAESASKAPSERETCLGYPECDGDLPGEPHEPKCPMFKWQEEGAQ